MVGELQIDTSSQTCEDTWDVVAQPFVQPARQFREPICLGMQVAIGATFWQQLV